MRVPNTILRATITALLFCYGCFTPRGDSNLEVTLEVSMIDIIRQLSGEPGDTALNKSLMSAEIKHQNSDKDFIHLFSKIDEYSALFRYA